MSYENPTVPHDVNVGKISPVVEFFRLLIAIALIGFLLTVLIYSASRWLSVYIPFRYEQAIAESFIKHLENPADKKDLEKEKIDSYIQNLTHNLAQKMALPANMAIQTHVISDSQINAFATLGGHILITRGLLENIKSENALAMVIAHEIAHIKNRDPITAASGAAVLSILMLVISGNSTIDYPAIATNMVAMSFSRSQEEAADALALDALEAYYGHIEGADDFFKLVLEQEEAIPMLEFFSTHPATKKRIDKIKNKSQKNQYFKLNNLPEFIKNQ